MQKMDCKKRYPATQQKGGHPEKNWSIIIYMREIPFPTIAHRKHGSGCRFYRLLLFPTFVENDLKQHAISLMII
jgi:hypothetical protein